MSIVNCNMNVVINNKQLQGITGLNYVHYYFKLLITLIITSKDKSYINSILNLQLDLDIIRERDNNIHEG